MHCGWVVSDLQLPSFLWPHIVVNPKMGFLGHGELVAEHFEGVKSTGAEVILPAFIFGCRTGAPQGPLYPGLNPQLQVLLAGIALQIPANRLFCSSPPSRRGYPRDGEKLRGPGGICGRSLDRKSVV